MPLIIGRPSPVVMNHDRQRTIAAWLAKMAMVADAASPQRKHVPQHQRDFLMTVHEPPDGWEVLIGTYSGRNWRELGLYQTGAEFDFQRLGTEATFGLATSGYLEATTLGIGDLFAYVVADDTPHIDFNVAKLRLTMKRVWPLGDWFSWPRQKQVDDDMADDITFKLFGHLQANFRPPPNWTANAR